MSGGAGDGKAGRRGGHRSPGRRSPPPRPRRGTAPPNAVGRAGEAKERDDHRPGHRPAIARADLLGPDAALLIGALNAELSAVYPEPGATHFRLDPKEVADGRGAFLVARCGGEPAGCGAVRRIEEGVFEVKRMYVVPSQRGRGLGRAILDALEAEARGLGARRIVLETGTRQVEAIALYSRVGYAVIPPFGEYLASKGISVCMEKRL